MVRHHKDLRKWCIKQERLNCYGKEKYTQHLLNAEVIIKTQIINKVPYCFVEDDFFSEKKIEQQTLTQQRRPIIFIGGTGCGKSSIIKAIRRFFDYSLGTDPKIGDIDPTTEKISEYSCINLSLWDTPGLGESPEGDKKNYQLIASWLKNHNDAILVGVLNSSSRDYGTTFNLLNDLRAEGLIKLDSVFFVLNRIDTMYKPGVLSLNIDKNTTLGCLVKQRLDEKIYSIKTRLKDSTMINGDVLSISAGDEFQEPINIKQLLEKINEY